MSLSQPSISLYKLPQKQIESLSHHHFVGSHIELYFYFSNLS